MKKNLTHALKIGAIALILGGFVLGGAPYTYGRASDPPGGGGPGPQPIPIPPPHKIFSDPPGGGGPGPQPRPLPPPGK